MDNIHNSLSPHAPDWLKHGYILSSTNPPSLCCVSTWGRLRCWRWVRSRPGSTAPPAGMPRQPPHVGRIHRETELQHPDSLASGGRPRDSKRTPNSLLGYYKYLLNLRITSVKGKLRPHVAASHFAVGTLTDFLAKARLLSISYVANCIMAVFIINSPERCVLLGYGLIR